MERIIHILKITIPLERGISWLFKNEHVMKLKQNYNLSDIEIARKVNCKTDTIKKFILDNRIPPHIGEKATQIKARTVLEDIDRSCVIPDEVKMLLYKKANTNVRLYINV